MKNPIMIMYRTEESAAALGSPTGGQFVGCHKEIANTMNSLFKESEGLMCFTEFDDVLTFIKTLRPHLTKDEMMQVVAIFAIEPDAETG